MLFAKNASGIQSPKGGIWMRTLLIVALTAILVGCSCPLPPQAGIQARTDADRFACLGKTAASQPTEPKPASLKANSEMINSTIAAKAEKPSSAHARDRDHLATKPAKSTMIGAKVEPPASDRLAGNAAASSTTSGANTANSPPKGSTAASSNTRLTQEQVTAATAVADHATTEVPTPEQKANNADRSDH